MKCIRKPYRTEQQARMVCIRLGMNHGVQFYAVWCERCRAYHATKGAA